jgi:hypothetical protein
VSAAAGAAVSTGAASVSVVVVVVSVAVSSVFVSPPQEGKLNVPRTIRPTYNNFFIVFDWFMVKILLLYSDAGQVTQRQKIFFQGLQPLKSSIKTNTQ